MKGTPKRPHLVGGAYAPALCGGCASHQVLSIDRRIPVEESERDGCGRDDTAEGGERRSPTQRRDQPHVHRVEGNGTARVGGAEALPIALPRDVVNQQVTVVVEGTRMQAVPAAPRAPKHR